MDSVSTLRVDKISVATRHTPHANPVIQRSSARSILLVFAVTCSMIVNIGSTSAFTESLPTIQKHMNLQEAQLQWIMSSYALSSGCLLLVFGRLADLYGRKKIFMFGSVVVVVFSTASAFAKNVMTLDILRGLQGVGVAAQTPASLGILAHAFPPSRARSIAFSVFASGAAIGAVVGTCLGGFLIQSTELSWRAVCYLFAGIGGICVFGGFIAIDPDQPSEEDDKRVDWIGAFLVTAGLVLIVFALSQGQLASEKWATSYIVASLTGGVFLIIGFLCWQHYLELRAQLDPHSRNSIFTSPPLLNLSLWTRAKGRLAAIMAISFTNWASFSAWLFWVQLYYQNYKHTQPMLVSLYLLPMFFSGLFCTIFVGFMVSRITVVWLLGFGTMATTVACLLFAIMPTNVMYWMYAFPAIVLSAMGADFVLSAGTLFIAKVAYPHEQSVAGALFTMMTQTGTALGVTITMMVFNGVSEKVIPEGKDPIIVYRAVQWTAFGFGVVASFLSIVAFRGVGIVGATSNGLQKPENISLATLEEAGKVQEK